MSWGDVARRPMRLESALDFGKHCGERLIDVIDSDPEYISWCYEYVDGFEERLTEEAQEAVAEVIDGLR